MKEQIREYLKRKYAETRWPNVYLAEIMNKFGPDCINALNELCAEGTVRPGNGINGRLVKYTEDPEDIQTNKERYSQQ
jgi:hypothetical protein